MNGAINTDFILRAYYGSGEKTKTEQKAGQKGSFLDTVSFSENNQADLEKTASQNMYTPEMLSFIYNKRGVLEAEQIQAEKVSETQSVSLEAMLKQKYPRLVYHVFDASSSFWKTRNDYPHYMLYQKNADVSALENWKPKGPNPEYMASKEIRALSQVPPGSRAVVIHPKVQARMEQEPEYAKEIAARIDAWFTFDLLRNEAIIPGCSMELSQSVAIGEDGNIVNVQTSSPGRITYSKSGSEEEIDYWEIRLNRHAYFLKQWQEEQIEHKMEVSRQFKEQNMTEAVKAQLARLINGNDFKNIIGDTIAGVSTDAVLAQTRALIWG
ncbi:MAG: hypothetical protein K1W19_02080 [Lachnospiraceae bacterium]|jgi:hypothetical protein|nr:hypothetical protein [Lachnospiraceae bacterium]MCI9371502.1 hypothetical protein [Lachnospiraceae bacterium]MDE7309457.1 hypothetical protein [Lachnospiraceae bacterium]